MVAEELTGITKLDEQIDKVHPATSEIIGLLSLRSILLNYLKMQDGHPMIAKVHQEYFCSPAHVIIPQAEEAERMIGMMHKNLPAFLSYMLQEAGFTEDFIKQLIKKSCEASLVAEASLCKWDSATRTLTTPVDEKHKKVIKAFEGAAWLKDEFGLLNKGQKTLIHLPQEDLFNLDGTASIKTIHDRHKAKETPIPKKGEEIDLTLENNRDSASRSSSSSSSENDGSSDEGSHSSTSSSIEEEKGVAGGG
jgi:hypothetical protein